MLAARRGCYALQSMRVVVMPSGCVETKHSRGVPPGLIKNSGKKEWGKQDRETKPENPNRRPNRHKSSAPNCQTGTKSLCSPGAPFIAAVCARCRREHTPT